MLENIAQACHYVIFNIDLDEISGKIPDTKLYIKTQRKTIGSIRYKDIK